MSEAYKLVEELLKQPKEDIESALTVLMLHHKLDYPVLSNAYVCYLNIIRDGLEKHVIECEICVLDSLSQHKDENNSIQRRLYLLNKSRRFKMEELNKELNYNESVGKNMSLYE